MIKYMLEVSVLILFILLLRKIFLGRVSSRLIYMLWGVVLIRLVLPVNFTSSLSLWNAVSAIENMTTADKEETLAAGSDKGQEQRKISTGQGQEQAETDYFDQSEDLGSKMYLMNVVEKSSSDTVGSEQSSDGPGIRLILLMLWISVATFMLAVLAVIQIRLLRRLRNDRDPLGVSGKVKIYRTSQFAKPCLYGVFSPAVYLPQGVSVSDQEEEQILIHELVHYRHGDHVWSAVRVMLLAIYWFHPLVWLAVFYSRKDAELACDESVIRQIGEENRFQYGRLLLRLTGPSDKKQFLYAASLMSNRGKELERRIRIISGEKRFTKIFMIPFLLLLLLVVGMTSSRVEQKRENSQEISKETKKESASEDELSEYEVFLKKHAEDPQYQYYSLVTVGDQRETILLVSEAVQEISNSRYGSLADSQLYRVINGQVTWCGKADAEEGVWPLFLDHTIITTTPQSITKIGREKNSDQIVTEERSLNKREKKKISAYIEWEDELKYGGVQAVLFYQNPYTKETREQGPEKLPLQTSTEPYVKETYVEKESVALDLTQDGVEDTLEIAWDQVKNPKDDESYTVSLRSGETGEILWGLPVNTVHAGWYGVYHYEEKGKPYLMVFQPAMYQGLADFRYKIFSVDETGAEQVLHSDQFQFDLNHPKETDPAAFENFVKNLNQYLRRAERIVSTLEGNVLTQDDAPLDLTYDSSEILQEMKQARQ